MRRRLILAVALLLAVTPAAAQTTAPPAPLAPVAVAADAPEGGSGGNPAIWILVGLAAGLILVMVALKGDGGAVFLPPA